MFGAVLILLAAVVAVIGFLWWLVYSDCKHRTKERP